MFLSTRNYDYRWYRFLVGASKKNCEIITKKKLKLKVFENCKFPNLSYIFFLINLIFTGKIFSKKDRALIYYKDIELGRFVVSNTLINFKTYINKRLFYFHLFKNFLKAGSLIKACENYNNNHNIEGLYVDHCQYINGIIFSYFSKKNIPIYTNNYPKGLFCINHNKKNNLKIYKWENALKIKKEIYLNRNKKIKAYNCLKKLTQKKNFNISLGNTRFTKITQMNYENFDYVIYTHSFTDGQMFYGYDGFENTLDWLVFTINILLDNKKNILIKPHPNFFNDSLTSYAQWDRKIFDLIKEKYKNFENICFLKTPVHNYQLLKRLKKNCILITKHGSVLLESSFMNYKTICSESNFFETNYRITNYWKNINQYKKLLLKDHKALKNCNKNDLHLLIYHLFYVYNSTYNLKNSYESIIKKLINIPDKKFNKIFHITARAKFNDGNKKLFKNFSESKLNLINKRISDKILLL